MICLKLSAKIGGRLV